MAGRFRRLATETVDLLVRALFPHFCVVCRQEGKIICQRCERGLSQGQSLFEQKKSGADLDGLLSTATYKGSSLAALLRHWKYERVTEAGEAITRAFEAHLRREGLPFASLNRDDIVVPVPMHRFREAYRGFNQADALAATFGRVMGMRVVPRLLRREFRWSRQASVEGRTARLKNAAGSVRVAGRVVRGGRYLLVDDVATTGATLGACAATLKSAGAAEVYAVTLLRD